MFLGKAFLKICSKFTREHPCRGALAIFVKISDFFSMTFKKDFWCDIL